MVVQKRQNNFKQGLISIFKLVFLQSDLFDFFLQDRNLNLFTSAGVFQSKVLIFFFVVESRLIRCAKRCCSFCPASIIKLIFSQLYLLPFLIKLPIGSFLLEAECSLLKMWEMFQYIGFVVLIDENWRKCFQCWHIWIIQLIFLENYRYEFVDQCLNRRWHSFECF